MVGLISLVILVATFVCICVEVQERNENVSKEDDDEV